MSTQAISARREIIKRVVWGLLGLALGGVFLWLALRNISRQDLASALRQLRWPWLVLGLLVYLTSIALRCVRWGVLLRASGSVRWRHAAETLIVGFAANYLLPARIGEVFRADYAHRLFHMSRFVCLGTIVVERICDGVIVVVALWISMGFILSSSATTIGFPSWMIATGSVASVVFGVALIFVIWSGHIDLRRWGLPKFVVDRWDHLKTGISSAVRGHFAAIIICSIGIWALEALALGSVIRAFGVLFSLPQVLVLVGLSALSTLIPTAPGYIGTYQFVFAQVFSLFDHPAGVGVVTSTVVQVLFFGSVSLLGIGVLLSRSSLWLWRATSPK